MRFACKEGLSMRHRVSSHRDVQHIVRLTTLLLSVACGSETIDHDHDPSRVAASAHLEIGPSKTNRKRSADPM
jgi:hypothetical protein